jgi:hypothetical protein
LFLDEEELIEEELECNHDPTSTRKIIPWGAATAHVVT